MLDRDLDVCMGWDAYAAAQDFGLDVRIQEALVLDRDLDVCMGWDAYAAAQG